MWTSVNARRARGGRTTPAALGVALALTAAGGLGTAGAASAASNVPAPSPACTTTGTATVCTLWAKTGTLTLPTGASPATVPIWGYAAAAADAPTAPGPVLVANEGDTVTITVNNTLAEATSLAIPQLETFASDGTGADPGTAKTYTFTASRPGTYLYQAGLTANGPRQAAMGLVGALVVRPATNPTTTLDGSAGTTFDDESLLVLTEVDNRLNANPTGFDMRTFAPRFRLINGGAYSGVTGSGTTIPTAAGARLLLRVVNAGLTEHSLGALGLRQDVLALGGRRLAHPYNVFAETAEPGQTVDTLTTIPATAASATFPLYETAAGDGITGNLANFGGMLAFITTGGTAGTTGPAVTNLAVTSNHVNPLAAFPVKSGDQVTVTGTAGATASAVEYAVDTQVGWTPATLVGGAITVGPITVPVGMTTGQHTVFVRATDGTTVGATSAVTFAVDNDGPKVTGLTLSPTVSAGASAIAISANGDDSTTGNSNTVSATYSLDGGAPVALTLNRTNNPVAALTGSITAAGAAGAHTVSVTARDALGNATATAATATYTVDTAGPAVTAGSILVNPAINDGTRESRVGSGAFTVSAELTDNVAVGYGEGFFDGVAAGAPGTGFAMLANSNATGTPLTVKVDVPLSELTALADGPHSIWVRGRDTAGNWGTALQSASDALVVDRIAPVITSSSMTATTAGALTGNLSVVAGNLGTGITASSWTIRTGAGATVGTGALGTLPGTVASGTLTASGVTYPANAGSHTLTISVTDGVGRTVTRTFPLNRIFVNGFESTTSPYGWTSRTGTGLTTTTTTPIAGARSGTVSLNSSGNYVTDSTPAAETAFRGQFAARITATTNTAGVGTLYRAYTADTGGTALFQVRVRRTGGNLQVGLAAGTGNVAATGWTTITSGTTYTLGVELAGTTAQLRLNGTLLANSVVTAPSGAGVGRVQLGAIDSLGTGTAVLDGYDSARTSLPS